jgi:hypothetical protein
MEIMKFGLAMGARAGAVLLLALQLTGCGADPSESVDDEQEPDESDESDDDSATPGALSPAKPGADAQAPTGGDGSAPGRTADGATRPGDAPPRSDDAGARAGASRDGGTRDAAVDPSSGDSGASQPGSVEPPVCQSSAPAEFQPNPSVGGGAGPFTDSPHFRIYGATGAQADTAIKALEAAYSCFVETLCWRSSGLSNNGTSDSGPYHKMNIYSVGSLGGAAGQMFSDARAGLSYLKVGASYLADPKVTVHEYGHALTYHEKGWVDQTRTGAWWETVANFVADTYMTSPLCEKSRARFAQPEGRTLIELNRVIGDSYQVIVDGSSGTGNYYQAWPFLTYLTTNLDRYPGLGATVLRDMFRKHMRNNETPLHVLERIAAPLKVQKIVGRYWARMAYLDIGHKKAQEAFLSGRSRLNFANLDAAGTGMYRVKANRQPRYFGSNIIPLKATGTVTAQVTSSAPFSATLAVRSSSGSVRYVELENGTGEATVESGEEASLVVVNTPAALYQYDPFMISGDVARGLDYQVQLTGATPAN